MPIYELKCGTCGHEFESMQKMNDPNSPCPKCGKETERQISASNFHLKGGGWFTDGYHKKKGAK